MNTQLLNFNKRNKYQYLRVDLHYDSYVNKELSLQYLYNCLQSVKWEQYDIFKCHIDFKQFVLFPLYTDLAIV